MGGYGVKERGYYSQFVLARFLGVLVALYTVDLAEHDVLEAVCSGARVLGVPLPAVREPILSQRSRQHQPELIPCNTHTHTLSRQPNVTMTTFITTISYYVLFIKNNFLISNLIKITSTQNLII